MTETRPLPLGMLLDSVAWLDVSRYGLAGALWLALGHLVAADSAATPAVKAVGYIPLGVAFLILNRGALDFFCIFRIYGERRGDLWGRVIRFGALCGFGTPYMVLAHGRSVFLGVIGVNFVGEMIRFLLSLRGTVSREPGARLDAFCRFVYSKKGYSLFIEPVISDMQAEWCEAMSKGEKTRAAWVRLRGYWTLAQHIGVYSIIRTFVDIVKTIGLGK